MGLMNICFETIVAVETSSSVNMVRHESLDDSTTARGSRPPLFQSLENADTLRYVSQYVSIF